MKKLLLIPTLGLTAITPVIAMTSCTKKNEDKKEKIVWEDSVRETNPNQFIVFSNKLESTWTFECHEEKLQHTITEDNRIKLSITETDLKSGISIPGNRSITFWITMNGEQIAYMWSFHLETSWDDCTSDGPA